MSGQASGMDTRNFNPLPPCGGRRHRTNCTSRTSRISIHSLRVEGDILAATGEACTAPFQSTPSVWRETGRAKARARGSGISIHSLRVEGDHIKCADYAGYRHFNPLPPCGGRRPRDLQRNGGSDFNPLPPCGGRQQNCTAFRLKLSRANAILTKKNTDTLLHVRKNTFFLIFSRKSRCESLLLFLCA